MATEVVEGYGMGWIAAVIMSSEEGEGDGRGTARGI